jgi:hypothetical protein
MLREGKLTANEPITTGLLQLMDGLRSILKIIEADDSEGDGEDTALIARLEELQAPAHAHGKHARVRAGLGHANAVADAPQEHRQAPPAQAPPAIERKWRLSRLPRRKRQSRRKFRWKRKPMDQNRAQRQRVLRQKAPCAWM